MISFRATLAVLTLCGSFACLQPTFAQDDPPAPVPPAPAPAPSSYLGVVSFPPDPVPDVLGINEWYETMALSTQLIIDPTYGPAIGQIGGYLISYAGKDKGFQNNPGFGQWALSLIRSLVGYFSYLENNPPSS